MAKWLKIAGAAVAGLILAVVVAVLITQRVSDGPISFLQGGPFRTGELVEGPITDWSFANDRPTEFELVGFGTSRTAGFIIHDGVAYMTCDLGYIWNRLDGGPQKWLLGLIYTFKHWHEDAVQDGRVLLRVDGKLYKSRFVKVEDPALNAALRSQLEALARKLVAPATLGPPPAQPPNDIWFFRMDPRA